MKNLILEEMQEKREPCAKHFRMAQKGAVAAVYPVPVHYEEGGQWKEIDNRIEPAVEKGKEVYRNRASSLKVCFAGESGADSLVMLEKDGRKVSWKLDTTGERAPEKVTAAQGAAVKEEYADGIIAEQDHLHTTPEENIAASRFRVMEKPEFWKDPAVLKEEKQEKAMMQADKENAQTAETGKVHVPEHSDAQAEETLSGQLDAAAVCEKMGVPHLSGEGIYEGILPGVDLHYVVYGERIKENIRLHTRDAAQRQLAFAFSHPGLEMHMEEDGSMGLYEVSAAGTETAAAQPAETEKDDSAGNNSAGNNSVGNNSAGDDNAECRFRFAKPYMYDAAGETSGAVRFELKQDGETSRVTVVPDMEWLLAEEREYPVVIDPMTETAKTRANIEDTYIFTGGTSSENPAEVYAYGSVAVGQSDGLGKSRALLRFKTLPDIGAGSIIYAATMYLWQFQYSTYGISTIPMMAHEITGSWDEKSARWANQPSFDANVLDYQQVGQVADGNTITITPVGFDVTRLVRQWYNTGKNYGIMVRSQYEDTTTLANRAYARFYASDAPDISSEQFPSGVFYYRNVNGLEDYQSYHEQPMGRAGTGYTNDYTGNVVWIHPDAETVGGPLQRQIRHVYNSSEAASARRIGYGWRLSCEQELKESGIADYPYVYIDEDRTKHYFYKDTSDGNKLKDEDGLGLTITMTSSSDYDRYRCMETKDKTKYVFAQDGFLRFIEDLDGNQIEHKYLWNDWGNYLSYVTDHKGARLDITYANDALMSRLLTIKDMAGRTISYSYDSADNLSKITYPDGKTTVFTYDGSHRLLSVTGPDGNCVKYTYTTDFRVPRVSKVSRYGTNQTLGQELKISYENGNTTVFEEPGLDGDLGKTADNKKSIWHFDNMGRPTDVLESDGYANTYSYYTQGMQNHKLGKDGATQKPVENLIRNPLFGAAFPDEWKKRSWTNQTLENVTAFVNGYQGLKAVAAQNTQPTGANTLQQEMFVAAGTYTLSAYVKTEGISTAAGSQTLAGIKRGAAIVVKNGDQILCSSRYIDYVTDTNVDDGWERLSVTFCLEEWAVLTLHAGIFQMTGTAYISGMQLELGTVANRLNVIDNSHFTRCVTGGPDNWTFFTTESGDKVAEDPEKGRCLSMQGRIDAKQDCMQEMEISGKEGDIYSLSSWVKAIGIPGKNFVITARVMYTDGTDKWHEFACSPNIIGWQFVCGTFRAEKAYQRIQVYLSYHNQVNKVLFTNVQLVRDDGESYRYDSEGNLTDAISAAEKEHFVSDINGNLIRKAGIKGTAFEYGFNDANRLSKASSSEGVRYRFSYDGQGQPTRIDAGGGRCIGAVIPGRSYYIRDRHSGNYLDVRGGANANGTIIQLNTFQGNAAQRWKLIDCNDGCYELEPENAAGKRLDLASNSNAEGAKIQLYQKNGADAQKWKLHPKADGCCWISCKGTDDKNGLTNAPKSTAANQAVQSCRLVEGNTAQMWYFEPADTGKISDAPADGKIYHIRVRHSGQYLDVDHAQTAAGTRVMQFYHNGELNQQIRLTAADATYFFMEPLHAPGMVMAKSGKNDRNLDLLRLEAKKTGAANQLFRFEEIEAGTTKGYAIICKDGNLALDVIDYTYTPSSDVILTAHAETQVNKWWILEECSDLLVTTAEYTSDGRQISKITDARGNSVRYEYDAKNRMLTKMYDAKGNATEYTYDANTDYLTKVKKTVGSTEVSVGYAYENDRLKTITHNGFDYGYGYDSYGNLKSVSVGGAVLETTTYRNRDGLTDRIAYATGEKVRSEYDTEERLKSRYLVKADGTEEKLFTNTYDNYGNVVAQEDHKNGVSHNCHYDLIGRLIGSDSYNSADGSDRVQLRTAYDKKNRVSGVTQKIDGKRMQTQYVYGDVAKKQKPGLLYGLKVDGTQRVSYEYDELARLKKRTLNLDNGIKYETTYGFVPGAKAGTTTTMASEVQNGDKKLSYTYDEMGNISKIYENGTLKCSYQYDELNRLVSEDNSWEGKTTKYTYDAGGNLLRREKSVYPPQSGPIIIPTPPGGEIMSQGTGDGTGADLNAHISIEPEAVTKIQITKYSYGNSKWKDQMTSYGGSAITYDAMGNPLSYRGMNLTWEKGHELKQAVKDGKTVTYAYAADGKRIKKTVDGVETRYYWSDGQIIGMKSGSHSIQLSYDERNQPVSMRLDDKNYYYLYNVQGDVIGLLDSTGSQVVSYQYNSWGKLLTTTDTTTEKAGNQNPFRYRGYCWDEETGLYYVGSRYYDPETCRFISPDTVDVLTASPTELTNKNLYAYCDNNPISREDKEGDMWHIFIGAGIGAVVGAVTSIGAQIAFTGKVDVKTVLIDAVAGGLSGALAVTGVSVWGQAIGNAAISVGSYLVSKGDEATMGGVLFCGAVGAIGGFFGGPGLKLKSKRDVIKYSQSLLQRFVSPKKIQQYTEKIITNTDAIVKGLQQFVKVMTVTSLVNNFQPKSKIMFKNTSKHPRQLLM